MRRLFFVLLFLTFSAPALAPIVPVLEIPQKHYAPVFSWIHRLYLESEKSRQALAGGDAVYNDEEISWVAYSEKGKLCFLLSVSLEPADRTKMQEKTGWQIFSSNPENFKKYSSEVILPDPKEEAIRLKLKPIVSAFGQFLPWTLIETGFRGDKELVEGVSKIMDQMEIFGRFQEIPRG